MALLMIISGPAGSGKNTVAETLMGEFKNVKRVITSTSRAPRGQEVDGQDYHFLAQDAFEEGIRAGHFYEYAKVHDKYYGTSRKSIDEALQAGQDLILIIDVQGAKTWQEIAKNDKNLANDIKFIFIAPDSIDELKKRLTHRATETQAQIDLRLNTALQEYQQKEHFEHVINSTTKEADYLALRNIYLG